MAEEKVKWDRWDQVKDAIKKSGDANSNGANATAAGAGAVASSAPPPAMTPASSLSRLIAVVYGQAWNPLSAYTLREVEKLRRGDDKKGGAGPAFKFPIFLVDADSETNRVWDQGIRAFPAIQFYLSGRPVVINRPGWAPDEKLVGSFNRENLTQLFTLARTLAETIDPSTSTLSSSSPLPSLPLEW